MPGLVCGVSLDGANEDLARFTRSALRKYEEEQQPYGGIVEQASATLGSFGAAASGVATHSSGLSLAIHGIVNSGAPGNDDPYTVASRILNAYVADGDDVFKHLNGRFIIAIWDEGAKRLTLVTDRLGLQRAYLWRTGSIVVVSTRMADVAGHAEFSARIRESSVVELIRAGFLLGDSTLLEDINLVPPASVVTIDVSGTHAATHWRPTFRTDHHAATSDDDFAHDLERMIYGAFQRNIDAGDAILLSSGYDSRTIAIAAARDLDPRSLRGFTLGPNDSLDVIYARRIAEELGIPFHSEAIPEDFFVRYGKRGVELAEGGVIGHTCWRCAGEEYLRSVAPRRIVHGLAGDMLQGNPLFDEILEETDHDKGWEAYRNRYPKPVLSEDEMKLLLKPDLYDTYRTHVHDTLRKVYDVADAEHPLHKIEAVLVHYHDRRYYSTQVDYSDVVAPVQFPFTDNELFQFMCDLPLRLRHNATLYKRTIGLMNANVARIPMAGTRMPVEAPFAVNMFYRVKRRINHTIATTLPWAERNRGAYVRYREWLRGPNRAYIERLLDQTDYLDPFFNIDQVRKSTKAVLDGESEDYGKVYNLATFVLFCKRHLAKHPDV